MLGEDVGEDVGEIVGEIVYCTSRQIRQTWVYRRLVVLSSLGWVKRFWKTFEVYICINMTTTDHFI